MPSPHTSHSPRYTPTPMRAARTSSHKLNGVILIVFIVFGLLTSGVIGCCGLLSFMGQSTSRGAIPEQSDEADAVSEADDMPESERWNVQLIAHIERGDIQAALNMLPESYRDGGPHSEQATLAMDAIKVALSHEGGYSRKRVSFEGTLDGRGGVVESSATTWHILRRPEHEQLVILSTALKRDERGELQVDALKLMIMHETSPGVYAAGWPQVTSSFDQLSGLGPKLAQRVRTLEQASSCRNYFAPYRATFGADERATAEQRANLKESTRAMCELGANVFSIKGLKQTGTSSTVLIGSAMLGAIKAWTQGPELGQPFEITYEKKDKVKFVIHSTHLTTFSHDGASQRFVIDGIHVELYDGASTEEFSLNLREAFMANDIPYQPAR